MNFRIADTFTDSLTKLMGEAQKAVKTTAFDLQLFTIHNSLSTSPGFVSIGVHSWLHSLKGGC